MDDDKSQTPTKTPTLHYNDEDNVEVTSIVFSDQDPWFEDNQFATCYRRNGYRQA
jgi:hypothetical protein